MSNEINKRITMYRKLLGLSQLKTAELMNMKSSTYSQMERDGSITCDRLLRLAEIFDVSPQYLLCGKNETKPDVLREDGIFKDKPTKPLLVLSKKEENFIKILRFLSKEDKNEVIQFLETKYNKRKK